MPLYLLVPAVVGGIALIAGLLWAFGWAERARLDADLARARFLRDHPEVRIDEVTLSADGYAAIVWFGGQAGLVFSVGDRFATRKLSGARVTRTDTGILVDLGEFGAPAVRLAVDPAVGERLHAA